ncbi:MAG: response regulator transcription factor [Gaiellaceae bacterium]
MKHGSVLVVDDDAAFRVAVSALLDRAGFLVLEAETGEEAVRIASEARPALVLLDLQLPGLNGYEICRELRDEFGHAIAIAFVTGARTEQLDRTAGLLVGADDYVVKPFDPDDLVARVRVLVRRAGFDGAHYREATAEYHLTGRELEVLRLLAEGVEHGEIADRLEIAPKTVGRHIEHILVKLDVHSRSQAVAFAYRHNLQGDAS